MIVLILLLKNDYGFYCKTAAETSLKPIVRDSLISYLYDSYSPFWYRHSDVVNFGGSTPLQLAESHFPHLIPYLVPRDPKIFQLICKAIKNDSWSEIMMMIRKYPRNKKEILHYTLWNSVDNNNLHFINTLMDSGVSPDVRYPYPGNSYSQGMTPLIAWITTLSSADIDTDLRMPAILIKNGCDVNAQDKYGGTALLHATYPGRMSLIELLLKHGANPNKANINGRTPLCAAALSVCGSEKRLQDTVHCLLKAGADPLAKDENGSDILLQSLQANNYEIAEILKNYPNHHQAEIDQANGDLAQFKREHYFSQLE